MVAPGDAFESDAVHMGVFHIRVVVFVACVGVVTEVGKFNPSAYGNLPHRAQGRVSIEWMRNF